MSIFLPWYYFRGFFAPGMAADQVCRVETQNTMVMRDKQWGQEGYVVIGCAQNEMEFVREGKIYINEIYGGEDGNL